MIYVAIAIGAFYVFAGFVVMRAMMIDKLMDQMLTALNSPPDAGEAARSRILSAGSYLTLASGAALTLLSPLALALFALNTLVQGGYLAWAGSALPPKDALEARGRQQTRNAFVIYVAAAAFVGWLALQGHLRAATTEALVLDAAIVAIVVIAAHLFIRYGRRSSPAAPFEPIPLDEIDNTEAREFVAAPAPPTRLRLAPEFHCHPLWDIDTGQPVNPLVLDLPNDLGFRIEDWDDKFQLTFNEADPSTSDFATNDERAAYMAEGRAIAAALKDVWHGELDIAEEFRTPPS